LFDSKLSGKKKLVKDGQIYKEVKEDGAFSKSFDIDSHSCTIIQHGEKYELRIDNQVFNHLLDLEKNKLAFSNPNPTSSSMISKSLHKDNKVVSSGLNHITNHTVEQTKAPMFNFSIKPAEQKRFSEVKHQFKIKSEDQYESREENHNEVSTTQSTNLIDFGGSEGTMKKSENNKINTIDLLGGVDFNNMVQNNNGKSQYAMPDMFNLLPNNG
jgi:hypothetical protein